MTAKPRKAPLRTCVACRAVRDKRQLVRIVRTPDGTVEIDLSGKTAGRGASICPEEGCFEMAARGALARSLQVGLDRDQIEGLRIRFLEVLEEGKRSAGSR